MRMDAQAALRKTGEKKKFLPKRRREKVGKTKRRPAVEREKEGNTDGEMRGSGGRGAVCSRW